jgi:phosphate transport system substrate-binding protein
LTRRDRVLDCIAGVLAVAGCSCGFAQQAYSPSPLQPGVIRSWGDDAMRGTMTVWERAFRRYHPEITFEDKLLGTATSMAGIITGTSDLSLMGRPTTVNEVIGFEWVFRVKPLGIQVMNGPLQGEGRSPALAVFVSRSNPVTQISMAQLAAILGCPAEPKASVPWSSAGAGGAWKSKPIHVFLYDNQTGSGDFLQQDVQGSKDCWNWEIVREFKDRQRNGATYPAGRQIIDTLKADPNGLAVSTLGYAGAGVKALPLAAGGKTVALTRESVVDGAYPLRRGVYIYINRAAGKQVEPKVKEFLRFILSEEGQALVQTQGDYLPLNAAAALEQRGKLE